MTGSDPATVATIAIFDPPGDVGRPGGVRLETLALPPRATGEIDVAITSAAICGSDLHTVLGHRSAPPRLALGHEGVGRVVSVDAGATDDRGESLGAGDRVVFALFDACGTCDRCVAGLEMKCRSLLKYGHESIDTAPHATGTIATHVRLLPGVSVVSIPDDIPDSYVVSAGCAVATAAAIVAGAGIPDRVLVYGAGAVGAYTIGMLAGLGVSVSVSDPSTVRQKLASRFGGTPVVPSEARSPESGQFPVVIEASGAAAALTDAFDRTELGGRIIAAGSVSPASSTVTFDPAILVTRRLSLIGVHNYRREDFRRAVEWLLGPGRDLPLDELVSPPMPLSDVSAGFELMKSARYPRVLLTP